MPNLKQLADGSLGFEGKDLGDGNSNHVSMAYNATSVDGARMVFTRSGVIKSIIGRVEVLGTDGGAVTAVIRKAPSGTAHTSGTVVHTGTYNLKGTINTNQTLTLSTTLSDLQVSAGDCIGIDFTGVLTAAVGVITVAYNNA